MLVTLKAETWKSSKMKHSDNFLLFAVLEIEGGELCKPLPMSNSPRPSTVTHKDTNLRRLSTCVMGGKRGKGVLNSHTCTDHSCPICTRRPSFLPVPRVLASLAGVVHLCLSCDLCQPEKLGLPRGCITKMRVENGSQVTRL